MTALELPQDTQTSILKLPTALARFTTSRRTWSVHEIASSPGLVVAAPPSLPEKLHLEPSKENRATIRFTVGEPIRLIISEDD